MRRRDDIAMRSSRERKKTHHRTGTLKMMPVFYIFVYRPHHITQHT